MHKFVMAALILCLGPVSALAEEAVRPLPRPAGLAVQDAPLLRPLRREGAGAADPRTAVEAALPPLPEPPPLILPEVSAGPLAEAEADTLPVPRAPRDRLAETPPGSGPV
jgi:hypothetical protein